MVYNESSKLIFGSHLSFEYLKFGIIYILKYFLKLLAFNEIK